MDHIGGYNFKVHVHLHKEREYKKQVREGRVKRNAREYALQKSVLESKLTAQDKEAGQKLRQKVFHAKKQSVEDAKDKHRIGYDIDEHHKGTIQAAAAVANSGDS